MAIKSQEKEPRGLLFMTTANVGATFAAVYWVSVADTFIAAKGLKN